MRSCPICFSALWQPALNTASPPPPSFRRRSSPAFLPPLSPPDRQPPAAADAIYPSWRNCWTITKLFRRLKFKRIQQLFFHCNSSEWINFFELVWNRQPPLRWILWAIRPDRLEIPSPSFLRWTTEVIADRLALVSSVWMRFSHWPPLPHWRLPQSALPVHGRRLH